MSTSQVLVVDRLFVRDTLYMGGKEIKGLQAADAATEAVNKAQLDAVAGVTTVGVSLDDSTPDHLEDKLSAGSNITLTTLNPGGNEQVEVALASVPNLDEGKLTITGTNTLIASSPGAVVGTSIVSIGGINNMGTGAVLVGAQTQAGGGGTAVGYRAAANYGWGTAIGRDTDAHVTYGSVALGYGCQANFDYSIAIGYSSTATAASQLVMGATSRPVTTGYFGTGVTSTAPADFTFHGTGGSGTDIAGANLVLAGGISTGAGAAGLVKVDIAAPSGSSSTPNTLATVATFNEFGLGIGTSASANIPLYVYEAAAATHLATVQTGSSSGVGGWRVLNDTAGAQAGLRVHGSATGGTVMGKSKGDLAHLSGDGGISALALGTRDIADVVIGTNDAAAMTIDGTTQAVTLSGNLILGTPTVTAGLLKVDGDIGMDGDLKTLDGSGMEIWGYADGYMHLHTGVGSNGVDLQSKAATNVRIQADVDSAGLWMKRLAQGGHFSLLGGVQNSDTAATDSSITGASAWASASTNDDGGALKVQGGASATAAGDGGDVNVYGGAGTDNDGAVRIGYTGSAAQGTVGFFDATPVAQQTKVSDPSGGATQDAEARTAINAIIDVLEAFGLSATS